MLMAARDWQALQNYLSGLSNSHFRTAGYIIAERLLPSALADDFWAVMHSLVAWQPKAFTVTMAKAARLRLVAGTLTLQDSGFGVLAELLRDASRAIDVDKIVQLWLPDMRRPETIERLFAMLGVDDALRRIGFLVRVDTLAAGFVLLRTLRFEEHNRPLLVTTVRDLMRRGSSLSFNQASLAKAFFGLDEVGGVFSLSLQPYEMARVDTDFDVYSRVVRKV